MIKLLNLTAASLGFIAVAFMFFAMPANAQAEETVVASGVWTKKSNNIDGAWSIVEKDGAYFVKLDEDFKTRNAPDLKIFLSPTSVDDLRGRNAVNGSLLISPLDSNKGAQTYEIPAGTDLSQFTSLIIHCERFTKLWGAAALETTGV